MGMHSVGPPGRQLSFAGGLSWFNYANKRAWSLGVVIIISGNAGLTYHLPTDAFSRGGATPPQPPLVTALSLGIRLKNI